MEGREEEGEQVGEEEGGGGKSNRRGDEEEGRVKKGGVGKGEGQRGRTRRR